ncbi:WD repeat-containing protein 89 isoform X2 [Arctopsyche grandis]|uniref:WD repeat-containing protein 89 isoform X2 n=1 Tax=Arctopsyche grandis TaxID=121162 RepID=UPI00406D965D
MKGNNSFDAENSLKNPIIDEKAVSLDNSYILKMCGNSSGKVAVALSDSTCEIYSFDNSSLKKLDKLTDPIKGICDIRFSRQNDSTLYIGSSDGGIRMWDTRSGNSCSTTYEDPQTRESVKPLISFDISCNDRVLCGGTEVVQNDAFMLFWDIRSKSLLGGYWNSHTDDIMQVQFSSQQPNKVVSGGVDGLINVFDISEQTEDDALQYSLSTECAVDIINWISDDVVSCITQNIDVQFWNVDSADQINTFTREDIAKAAQNINVEDCYIVDVYNTKENIPFLVTGSYADERKGLKLLQVTDDGLVLKSNLDSNKQIVRCSWYDRESELLVSGGEMGILSLWKSFGLNTNAKSKTDSSLLMGMKKLKVHKNKPY